MLANVRLCTPNLLILLPTLQELLDWFGNTAPAASQQQQSPQKQQLAGLAGPGGLSLGLGGRRLTRSLSKSTSGASSLSDEQKELLARLMSRGLEARASAEEAAAAGGFAGALSGFPTALSGLGGGVGGKAGAASSLPPRMDPLKRTRSSHPRSGDVERAAAQLVQQAGLAAQAAAQAAAAAAAAGGPASGPAHGSAAATAVGFRGFPKLSSGGGSSGASLGRTASGRRRTGGGAAAAPASGLGTMPQLPSMPNLEPSPMDRGFSDVLVTPAFSSNEIRMLLEALQPSLQPPK